MTLWDLFSLSSFSFRNNFTFYFCCSRRPMIVEGTAHDTYDNLEGDSKRGVNLFYRLFFSTARNIRCGCCWVLKYLCVLCAFCWVLKPFLSCFLKKNKNKNKKNKKKKKRTTFLVRTMYHLCIRSHEFVCNFIFRLPFMYSKSWICMLFYF